MSTPSPGRTRESNGLFPCCGTDHRDGCLNWPYGPFESQLPGNTPPENVDPIATVREWEQAHPESGGHATEEYDRITDGPENAECGHPDDVRSMDGRTCLYCNYPPENTEPGASE